MRGVLVRPARPGDGAALAPCLRASDLQEIRAVGSSPDALEDGVAGSSPCWAVEVDGRVEGLWGVGRPSGALRPTAWFLQSGALTPRQLARHAPVWLARMLREAGQDLWNVVPAESVAEAWLARLGARLSPDSFASAYVPGLSLRVFTLPLEILDRV